MTLPVFTRLELFVMVPLLSARVPFRPRVCPFRVHVVCRLCVGFASGVGRLSVDENGPVVVMSGVLRFEIFRMTRSITHVIKFSMKQTSGRLGTQLIRSGVVELLG